MPATTIIFDEKAATIAESRPEGDDLWLRASDLPTASGWEIKPEGVCRDEVCIPLTAERAADMLRGDGPDAWFDLASFARYLGQPIAHDDSNGVWYFGPPSTEDRASLLALDAPDFTLPDLAGNELSLSAYRGKKVLLLLWSSW